MYLLVYMQFILKECVKTENFCVISLIRYLIRSLTHAEFLKYKLITVAFKFYSYRHIYMYNLKTFTQKNYEIAHVSQPYKRFYVPACTIFIDDIIHACRSVGQIHSE